MRDPSQEKRILVTGKTQGQTLLDVTLSESCFERVARSGIAVSVWEDVVGADGRIGTVGAVGGVSGARARVFMIQVCRHCVGGDREKVLTKVVDEVRARVRFLLFVAWEAAILDGDEDYEDDKTSYTLRNGLNTWGASPTASQCNYPLFIAANAYPQHITECILR
jgi:hypothetical protein